jgi:hypothetical protein
VQAHRAAPPAARLSLIFAVPIPICDFSDFFVLNPNHITQKKIRISLFLRSLFCRAYFRMIAVSTCRCAVFGCLGFDALSSEYGIGFILFFRDTRVPHSGDGTEPCLQTAGSRKFPIPSYA